MIVTLNPQSRLSVQSLFLTGIHYDYVDEVCVDNELVDFIKIWV